MRKGTVSHTTSVWYRVSNGPRTWCTDFVGKGLDQPGLTEWWNGDEKNDLTARVDGRAGSACGQSDALVGV